MRFVLPLVLLVAVFVPLVREGGRTWALGPFTVHETGLQVFASVAAKATIGTVSAALLGATTTFPAVLRGLEAMRVPRLLILIAAFMYRYLFVIVEEVGRMRAALAARGYRPRTALQAGALGRVATAMFLRTYAAASGCTRRCSRAATAARCRSSLRSRSAAPTCCSWPPCAWRSSAARGGAELRRPRHADLLPLSERPAGAARVDLHVEHGERVALLGPNGAGKTTLMLTSTGCWASGGLEVAGVEVGRRRRSVGAAPSRGPGLPGPRRPAVHADRRARTWPSGR